MNNNEEIGFKYRAFHSKNALYWNNLANQRQFELAKQLLILSSLILTVSATAIVSFRGINFQSQPLQSYSILLSWLFGLISIICGLKQLCVDASYFDYLARDENIREGKFATMSLEKAKLEVSNMKPTNPRGDEKWLYLQQVFFALGIVFITVSAVFILAAKIS